MTYCTKGIECQTWMCDMSELRFKVAIYLELDNISGYMKLKSVLLLLKLPRH